MSWRSFLFAADALRLEDGVGFQVPGAPPVMAPVGSADEQKARNVDQMAAFKSMMSSVQVGKSKR